MREAVDLEGQDDQRDAEGEDNERHDGKRI
jgi:hypothetical protein